MSSSLNYKLAAFLIVLGALSGIVCLLAYYLRDIGTKGKLSRRIPRWGEGTGNEHFRPGNGNFSDPAWWNEPYAPIPCLHLLVRRDYQLFEVLFPVA